MPATLAITSAPADLHRLLIAAGLGLLVGLQRQWSEKTFAGIRTFSLISIVGATSGLLAAALGPWTVAASFVGLAALIVAAYLTAVRESQDEPQGITTEVAAMAMFLVGALAGLGSVTQAVVIAGCVVLLLMEKPGMHRFVERLGADDLKAISRLVLAGMVILPALPNRAMGPRGALNPFEIWLMVVLVVGVSLAAYVAARCLGARKGLALAGVIGGLISSTATAVSCAQSSRSRRSTPIREVAIVLISSTTALVRVMLELAVVADKHWWRLAPPLSIWMLVMMAFSGLSLWSARRAEAEDTQAKPPTGFRAAVVFGLLYALVLVAVAVGKERLGSAGLYIIAGLSGMTDMDAITLSTGRLVTAGTIDPAQGWRVILVGGMANFLFKLGVILVIGSPSLSRQILWRFILISLAGAGVIFLWP